MTPEQKQAILALFNEMWRDFWRATRTVEPFTIGASRLEPHTLFGVDYRARLEALLAEAETAYEAHDCPYCGGDGYTTDEDDFDEPCSLCDGDRKVYVKKRPLSAPSETEP